MKVTSLHELFAFELQHTLSIEEQITESLPLMIEKASTPALKSGLTEHLEATKKQHQTVIDLCKEFSIDPTPMPCKAVEAIAAEGKELLESNDATPLLDLAIISTAQKVEHYEIACYGTITNYAQEMGHEDAQDLLHKILEEEKAEDEALTKLAESIIPQAPSGME